MSQEPPTDEFYYTYGLNGSTGAYLDEPLTPVEVADAAREQVEKQSEAQVRILKARADMLEPSMGVAMDVDVRKLDETGWGVIFAKGADSGIKDALQPLLNHRQDKVGDLFKAYEGDQGYLPHDTWESFRKRHKVKAGLAKPEQMPYYLLIVGDPETIPYDFQYLADVERAVGRIYFDKLEDYAYYAQSIVRAEDKEQPIQLPRRATFFGTRNPDDEATKYSSQDLIAPLGGELAPTLEKKQWALDTIEPADATKARLGELLGGSQTPSLLFTATHGAAFNQDDAFYPRHQGALVTQEWPGQIAWKKRLKEDFFFSGEDVRDAAQLWGMIAVFFACFGAGTPRLSDFYHLKEYRSKEKLHLADEALLAPLPMRLLSHPKGGALAVAGHVDRAWITSFKEGPGPFAPRDLDAFKELFRLLFLGFPLGAALEDMNTRYAQCSIQITNELYPVMHQGMIYTDDLKREVARLWTANNDARNYIIVGDPAVRLPVINTGTAVAERPILPAFEVAGPSEAEPPEAEIRADGLTRSEQETGIPECGSMVDFLPVPEVPEGAQLDGELADYWREYVKASLDQSNQVFRRILDAFLGPYHAVVWMNGVLVVVGLLIFIGGITLSIWFNQPLFALAFGGLGAASFLGYFVSRPLRSLEENLEFITWLGIVYNTYWSRLLYAVNPDTVQEDLQKATKETIAEIERLIDKHARMSRQRFKLWK